MEDSRIIVQPSNRCIELLDELWRSIRLLLWWRCLQVEIYFSCIHRTFCVIERILMEQDIGSVALLTWPISASHLVFWSATCCLADCRPPWRSLNCRQGWIPTLHCSLQHCCLLVLFPWRKRHRLGEEGQRNPLAVYRSERLRCRQLPHATSLRWNDVDNWWVMSIIMYRWCF